MGGMSAVHWLLVGVVVILLFGGSRFSNMMGDVAKGIKSFKKGMAEDDEPTAPAQRIEAKRAAEPAAVQRESEPVRDDRV